MLDSNGETINIRNLTLPEAPKPQRSNYFDPERDISVQRWSIIASFFDRYKDINQQDSLFTYEIPEDMFIRLLAEVKLLAPERVADFPADTVKEKVLRRLKFYSSQNNNTVVLPAAIAAAQIYERAEVIGALSPTFHEWLVKEAGKPENYDQPRIAQLIFGAHVLFPDEQSKVPILAFNPNWIKELDDIENDDGIEMSAWLLRYLKYTHPGEIVKYMSQNKWQALSERLNMLEDLPRIIALAHSMSVLAADRVEIETDGRYKLLNQIAPQTSGSPLPVIKK